MNGGPRFLSYWVSRAVCISSNRWNGAVVVKKSVLKHHCLLTSPSFSLQWRRKPETWNDHYQAWWKIKRCVITEIIQPELNNLRIVSLIWQLGNSVRASSEFRYRHMTSAYRAGHGLHKDGDPSRLRCPQSECSLFLTIVFKCTVSNHGCDPKFIYRLQKKPSEWRTE
jgi:hypothetical protein